MMSQSPPNPHNNDSSSPFYFKSPLVDWTTERSRALKSSVQKASSSLVTATSESLFLQDLSSRAQNLSSKAKDYGKGISAKAKDYGKDIKVNLQRRLETESPKAKEAWQAVTNGVQKGVVRGAAQISTGLSNISQRVADMELLSSSSHHEMNEDEEERRRRQWIRQQQELEDQERERVMRESEEACLQQMASHLVEFVAFHPQATYEEWIEELHPENAHEGQLLHGFKCIDHRFYVEESDHRILWNSNIGNSDPSRFVPPRTRLFRRGESDVPPDLLNDFGEEEEEFAYKEEKGGPLFADMTPPSSPAQPEETKKTQEDDMIVFH